MKNKLSSHCKRMKTAVKKHLKDDMKTFEKEEGEDEKLLKKLKDKKKTMPKRGK